jgi:hypothetical protein
MKSCGYWELLRRFPDSPGVKKVAGSQVIPKKLVLSTAVAREGIFRTCVLLAVQLC